MFTILSCWRYGFIEKRTPNISSLFCKIVLNDFDFTLISAFTSIGTICVSFCTKKSMAFFVKIFSTLKVVFQYFYTFFLLYLGCKLTKK